MNTPLPKLAAPAQRALDSISICYLEDLTKFTQKEIMDLHGMGPNAMQKIKAALKQQGLDFS